jgi:hypothetical protein
MKRKILASVAVLVLAACNKKEEKLKPMPVPEITQPAPVVPQKTCYLWDNGKDSIAMTIAMNGNNANGELAYNFFEKDKSHGTFSGVFIGDTLFADYNFSAEGTKSIREIAFVRKGESMVEGHGEMEEKDKRQVFKDVKKLKFEGVVLARRECE